MPLVVEAPPAPADALALVDHADSGHLLTELFRVLPMFRLTTAVGPQGRRVLADRAPAVVVVVDVREPEAMLAELVSGSRAPAVVVLGTDPRPAAGARLLALGAVAHFLKPVDLAHLAGVLRPLARSETIDPAARSEPPREGSTSRAHTTPASWN